LLPLDTSGWTCDTATDLDAVIGDLDVVYLLRIQNERGGGTGLTSLPEYVRRFGLDDRRFSLLHEDAVIMHPGPMNRGVEIAPQVADHPRTLILDQVRNGVAARMAVLFRLLTEGGSS
jgi:aspartate carbamoyltransferase catalytic subunit